MELHIVQPENPNLICEEPRVKARPASAKKACNDSHPTKKKKCAATLLMRRSSDCKNNDIFDAAANSAFKNGPSHKKPRFS